MTRYGVPKLAGLGLAAWVASASGCSPVLDVDQYDIAPSSPPPVRGACAEQDLQNVCARTCDIICAKQDAFCRGGEGCPSAFCDSFVAQCTTHPLSNAQRMCQLVDDISSCAAWVAALDENACTTGLPLCSTAR